MRRRDRDPVVDGVAGARPSRAAARRSTSSRTTSRGSTRRRHRVHLRRGDLPDGLPLHRLHALDGGDPRRTGTGSRAATSSAAPTSTSTASQARRDASPALIAVYARRETERRAVDLALAGLMELFERRPGDPRRCCSGRTRVPSVPFPAEDWGVRPPRDLAALYRRASAGVVFSLTTHSLVAQEMMASGLPLVELNGRNVTSELGESGELARARPSRGRTPSPTRSSAILDDREAAAAMARRAARVRRGAHLGARGRPDRRRALRLPVARAVKR